MSSRPAAVAVILGAHGTLGTALTAGLPAAGWDVAATIVHILQADLAGQGLSLKVYDCYRPRRAVDDFIAWARRPSAGRFTSGTAHPATPVRRREWSRTPPRPPTSSA